MGCVEVKKLETTLLFPMPHRDGNGIAAAGITTIATAKATTALIPALCLCAHQEPCQTRTIRRRFDVWEGGKRSYPMNEERRRAKGHASQCCFGVMDICTPPSRLPNSHTHPPPLATPTPASCLTHLPIPMHHMRRAAFVQPTGSAAFATSEQIRVQNFHALDGLAWFPFRVQNFHALDGLAWFPSQSALAK